MANSKHLPTPSGAHACSFPSELNPTFNYSTGTRGGNITSIRRMLNMNIQPGIHPVPSLFSCPLFRRKLGLHFLPRSNNHLVPAPLERRLPFVAVAAPAL